MFEGDSITAGGYTNPSNYPALAFAAVAPSFTYTREVNTAINGSVTADCVSRESADNAFLAPTLQKSILSVLIGHNDLANGRTVLQLETDITTYCQAMQAAGWKVVVSTLLPSTIVVGFNALRNTFNTWLRANYLSFANALADPASDATIGTDASASNTTYYVDGTHPTTAAGPFLYPYFSTAILSL